MFRLSAIALIAFVAGALGRAEACTLILSLHKSGSPEAIAEERKWKQELAASISHSEIIFVGKTVVERLPDLGEISAGIAGRWGGEIPGVRSWFEPVSMLKGEADASTINIFSGMYGSTCGYGPSLKVGATVVVYADKRSGYWFGEFTTTDILPYLEPLLR